jgi:prolyl-tRNA synthetase
MKLSQNFAKTLREAPSDETSKNAQLLIQAGYISKTMPGVYAYLPLGMRVLNKVEQIVRKHMDLIGCQEIWMNNLHPKAWWEQTDRWDHVDVLFKLKSQTEAEYALSPTHEEQISSIIKQYISSWKDVPAYNEENGQKPLAVYQIQTKFRDEIRSKSGLMRGREFRMKDMYDFHTSAESQDAYYELITKTYLDIYQKLGLEAYAVRAGGGVFAKFSHEFQVETSAGEDWMVVWSDGMRDNVEISQGTPTDTNRISSGIKEYREGLIDQVRSVKDHATAAGVEQDRILKSVLYVTEEEHPRYVGVAIRGDLDINEDALSNELDCSFHLAEVEDLQKVGTIRGRFSPIQETVKEYKQDIVWLFDESLRGACDMVTGYFVHVDVDRDLVSPQTWVYVAEVKQGFVRADEHTVVAEKIVRSAEVGNIFKLGTRWTKAFEITYMDQDNQIQVPIMGCNGIGTSRCVGVLAEIYADEQGLKLPEQVAPYTYHIISHINPKDDEIINKRILEISKALYEASEGLHIGEILQVDELDQTAIDAIWDDREISLGKKFGDADLIGCPWQIIVTKKSLENGGIEIKNRATGERRVVQVLR